VPIIYAGKTLEDLYNQTLPHLKYTKKIYFAGGEPLIQWEHWKILDKLLEQNNTDISLVYNTNFSTMKYKNKNVVDYWKQFKNIKLLLSIDGMEKGGDWWRHGNSWEKLQNNIETVKTECPHISLGVTCTVGWANLYTAMDLIDYCSDTHLINPEDININVLQYPVHFCVQTVPDWKKQELEIRIKKTFSKYISMGFEDDSLLARNLIALIDFMWAKKGDTKKVKGGWSQMVTKKDMLRGENFFEAFPEHINMRELVE
jgi:sulfatase maturation enzyme AslB (radical SAM superfamily)